MIEPSILDVDVSKANLSEIEKYCNRVHIDVVPGGKYTPTAVKGLKTELVKDVHLMIPDAYKKIGMYKNAGADIINVHVEDCDTERMIKKIKKMKLKVGLALNPETPAEKVKKYLREIDEVLIMSVHPGKGGQKFINVLDKVNKIKKWNDDVIIKVDGGIKKRHLTKLKKADYTIMGSYIFNKKNPVKVLKNLSLKYIARNIRKDIIEMIYRAGSGHPGGALGMTDIFTTLYFDHLKYDVKNPKWKKRDLLVLSNGHICPVLYSCLARVGFFPRKELKGLRKTGKMLEGHPSLHIPGIENSSGPLGIGLSQAAGMALAGNKVICMMSDGEHDEGNTWEAIMFAAKYKLNNLISIIDYNGIQLSGNTNKIMPLGDLAKKYKTFGWNVRVINGHDFKQIKKALKYKGKKPLAIIAKTTPGKGISFMEHRYEWHGKAPNEIEYEKAMRELDESM